MNRSNHKQIAFVTVFISYIRHDCTGFTVTSHAVSRARLAPLVGKRFVAGGLRVYFAWIHALFAFSSVLVWGTSGIVWSVDGSF